MRVYLRAPRRSHNLNRLDAGLLEGPGLKVYLGRQRCRRLFILRGDDAPFFCGCLALHRVRDAECQAEDSRRHHHLRHALVEERRPRQAIEVESTPEVKIGLRHGRRVDAASRSTTADEHDMTAGGI